MKGAAKVLQQAKFDDFNTPANASSSKLPHKAASLPRDPKGVSHSQVTSYASLVAQGDSEAVELIKFVEDTTTVPVE